MKTEHVESFLVITRYGSLHRAAAATFVAQSTLTHRIRQLEQDLGVTLFSRHSGGVVLTDAGKRFVPVARSMIDQLQAFARQAHVVTPLTIVAGKAFASYELPRLIGGFRRANPSFRCFVRSTLFTQSMDLILSGAADLAFVGHEIAHPAITYQSLGDDQIVMIMHPQHPWRRTPPELEDFGQQEVIAFGDEQSPFRERVEQFLARAGVSPNTIMELDSISAVKRMVMQDLGVAFLPLRTVREETAAGHLYALDIAEGSLTRPTLLAFLRTRADDKWLRQFSDWIAVHY